jgi:hypothetical protein
VKNSGVSLFLIPVFSVQRVTQVTSKVVSTLSATSMLPTLILFVKTWP